MVSAMGEVSVVDAETVYVLASGYHVRLFDASDVDQREGVELCGVVS